MRNKRWELVLSFGWVPRRAAALLLATNLATAPAQAQQQQGAARRPNPETQGRASARASDIISDNLDRVAASAEQILEVLHK